MPLRVEAIYEKGVLRPLEPLDLKEHERVVVSVVKAMAPGCSTLDLEYIEKIKREERHAAPAPGLEEVRLRLAKISGSMAAEVISERGER
jgi:predicted DNA-binding antitoxin AbrB/MazE fold protein